MVRAIRNRKSRQSCEPIATCEDEIAVIGDYLSSDLDPQVLRSFENHLEGCQDCAAFLRTYKKTVEITRAFLRNDSFAKQPK